MFDKRCTILKVFQVARENLQNIMDGYSVGEPFFSRRLEENVNLLMKALKDPALPLLELQVIYPTIIPRARMGSESIAHQARGGMGY